MPALDDYFDLVGQYVGTAEKIIGNLRGKLQQTEQQLETSVASEQAIYTAAKKVKSAVSYGPMRDELLFYVKGILEFEKDKPVTPHIQEFLTFLNANPDPNGDEELWIEMMATDLRRIYSNYFGGIGQIFLKLRDPKETQQKTFNAEIYGKFDKATPISVVNDDGHPVATYTNQFNDVFQTDVDPHAFGNKMLAFNLKELELPNKTAAVLAYGPSGAGKTYSMDQLYKWLDAHNLSSTNKIKEVRAFQFYNDDMRPVVPGESNIPEPFVFEFQIPDTTLDLTKRPVQNSKKIAVYPFAEKINPEKNTDRPYNFKKYQSENYPAYNGYTLDFATSWPATIKRVAGFDDVTIRKELVLPGLELSSENLKHIYYVNNKELVEKKETNAVAPPIGDRYFERFKQTRIYDTLYLSYLLSLLDPSIYNDTLSTRYGIPLNKDGKPVYDDTRPLSLQILPYVEHEFKLPWFKLKQRPPKIAKDASASEKNLCNYALFDHSEFKFPNFFPEFENIISKSYVSSFESVQWHDYKESLVSLMQGINRARFSRKMAANPESSRSQLVVEIKFVNDSKLIMMDLAGNETSKGASTSEQVAFFEATYINQTLQKVKENTLAIIESKGVVEEPPQNADPFTKYLNEVRRAKPTMTFLVCAYGYYKKDKTMNNAITTAIRSTMDFVQDIFPNSLILPQPAPPPVEAPKPPPVEARKPPPANGPLMQQSKKAKQTGHGGGTKKHKRIYHARTRPKKQRRKTRRNSIATKNPSITKRIY
jgi:hypothetical protein